jgi:hypothetical protein
MSSQAANAVHEKAWQFQLPDPVKDPGAYFDRRAKEMAEALNYRLVSTSEITVKPSAASRLVSGKALVEGNFIFRKGGRLPNNLNRPR